MKNFALVLTGGGARAAYQAGAVRALAEMWPEKKPPFDIITGISAGSVNACLLAHYADDFKTGGQKLWDLWHDLTVERVITTDALTLGQLGVTLIRDLVLGGFFKSPASSHLLDTRPLRKIITDNVDFGRIHGFLQSGMLRGFGVTATNYHNGCAVTFFDSATPTEEWGRGNHLSAQGPLNDSHIMASSAIPIFFPPIEIEGRYYGDGSVRLLSPLSPAIHLGAEKILAIGIRHLKAPEAYKALDQRAHMEISFADIGGVFLNAVFLDSLESDLERIARVNYTLEQVGRERLAEIPGAMRIIPIQAIRPSRDLGQIAAGGIERFPFLLKHLLRGLGARRKRGNDVLSYIAFDKSYCGKLLRLGYKDTMKRRDEMLKFMKGEE
jgi:NTE family protein